MKTFDLVRIIDTDELAVIQTVTNTQGRLSCSVKHIKHTKDLSIYKVNKVAWFEADELEILGNVVEVISRMTIDKRCSDIVPLEIK